MSDGPKGDHVFISYAWEDMALADWLGAKLAYLGYKVWRDQEKMYGGESVTLDIDDAIRNKSHRLLAILSPSSLNKPNPMKERTLALNLSRKWGIDFLIPLNAGVQSDTLHWNISDLTYIDFRNNWATGLETLLKALTKADTPRTSQECLDSVTSNIIPDGLTLDQSDPIITNLFPIVKFPGAVLEIHTKLQTRGHKWEKARCTWPAYPLSPHRCLAFHEPHDSTWKDVSHVVDAHRLEDNEEIKGVLTKFIVKHLVAQTLRVKAITLCMQTLPNGSWLHFPPRLVDTGYQSITALNGKRNSTALGGTRSYFIAGKGTEKYRYSLSPRFKVRNDFANQPLVCERSPRQSW